MRRFRGGLDFTKVWRRLDSIKVWRRTGFHKGLEEDWTPQRPGGGLDSSKVLRRTKLHKGLEED